MDSTTEVLYEWRLRSGDAALARRAVESLRSMALQLALKRVGEIVELSGSETAKDTRLARWRSKNDSWMWPAQAIYFEATFPGDQPRLFGLGLYDRGGEQEVGDGWSWFGAFRTSNLRASGNLMQSAAELGLEVEEVFGGTLFMHRRDADNMCCGIRTDTFDLKRQ